MKMKDFENKESDQSNTESEANFDFTVMSYNILSQNLLEDNSHLYKHCRQRLLIWTYRFPNILQEIKQLDADVSRKSACRYFLKTDKLLALLCFDSLAV